MPTHTIGSIKYYTFESLNKFGIEHAMVTRHGGVSAAPWDTLNLGATVGDKQEHVIENMHRFREAFKIDRERFFDVWQVHGDHIVNATASRKQDEPHQKADAILTEQKNLTLLMRFADCVPILLFDPGKKVIGITHAGWKGTVKKVVAKSVVNMEMSYGSKPADIIACIGPSIAGHHYEVGPDVIEVVKNSLGIKMSCEIIISKNGANYFDLWRGNRLLLEGVGVTKIENLGICTACDTHEWFSHRAEGGRSGRFGVFIRL